jgi:hypothetical protein
MRTYLEKNPSQKSAGAIALSVVWRGLRGRANGGNVNNVQYKINQNCHYEPPLYNEYILIKKLYI